MDRFNSPDEVASLLANTESATGSWFLVTQGIEQSIYSSWSALHILHFTFSFA
jgi:hypothetical protein